MVGGTRWRPGAARPLGIWHPDSTTRLVQFGILGSKITIRGRCPQTWALPHAEASGAQKHSWLWGTPCTSIWRCKTATGPVIAVQIGAWKVSLSLGITICGHLVQGHSPDSEDHPKGHHETVTCRHLGLGDIPNSGDHHAWASRTDSPQTHSRANCFPSPVQMKATHKYQHPAKPKPAKLRNQSQRPA